MAKAIMSLPQDVRDQIAQQVMEGIRSKAWENFPHSVLEGLTDTEQHMLQAAYDLGVQHGMSAMGQFLTGHLSLDAKQVPEYHELIKDVILHGGERADRGPEEGSGEDEGVQAPP